MPSKAHPRHAGHVESRRTLPRRQFWHEKVAVCGVITDVRLHPSVLLLFCKKDRSEVLRSVRRSHRVRYYAQALPRGFLYVLHRSLEDDGVDFWWIDWQLGEYSRTKGIDVLWLLNLPLP
jgi:hypothetical protein